MKLQKNTHHLKFGDHKTPLRAMILRQLISRDVKSRDEKSNASLSTRTEIIGLIVKRIDAIVYS